MENQIEIKIVNGFWTINNKKIADCSHAKKDFFDKYIKLSLIKSPITEKSSPTFKNKANEVKKSFNYRFKNTEQMIEDFMNSHAKIENLIFELKH
jgi:hypothetical protein